MAVLSGSKALLISHLSLNLLVAYCWWYSPILWCHQLSFELSVLFFKFTHSLLHLSEFILIRFNKCYCFELKDFHLLCIELLIQLFILSLVLFIFYWWLLLLLFLMLMSFLSGLTCLRSFWLALHMWRLLNELRLATFLNCLTLIEIENWCWFIDWIKRSFILGSSEETRFEYLLAFPQLDQVLFGFRLH